MFAFSIYSAMQCYCFIYLSQKCLILVLRFICGLCVCSHFVFQPLIVDMLPYPFNEEIKGIASASDVPLGQACSFMQTCLSLFTFSIS